MKNISVLFSLLVFIIPHQGFSAEVASMLQQAVSRCELINPRASQSGLVFNPEGYRTYYERSACMQRAAIDFRERPLCNQVKRRYALFSSGWGYSRSNCRDLVDEGVAEDRAELEELRQNYSAGPVRLSSVIMERNGNGRDYDFIPRFADGYEAGYQMDFYLTDESGTRHLILQHGSYLRGSSDNIRLFLQRQQLLSGFPTLESGVSYTMEVHLMLSIGIGGPRNWLRPSFVEEVFPEQTRTEVLTTRVSF
jgi:hypothetical protein